MLNIGILKVYPSPQRHTFSNKAITHSNKATPLLAPHPGVIEANHIQATAAGKAHPASSSAFPLVGSFTISPNSNAIIERVNNSYGAYLHPTRKETSRWDCEVCRQTGVIHMSLESSCREHFGGPEQQKCDDKIEKTVVSRQCSLVALCPL